eukprot:866958-Prymnesium_polylepis.1
MQQRYEARAAAQATGPRRESACEGGGEGCGESFMPGRKRGAAEGRVATPRGGGEEARAEGRGGRTARAATCLLYTSPSPRDAHES